MGGKMWCRWVAWCGIGEWRGWRGVVGAGEW